MRQDVPTLKAPRVQVERVAQNERGHIVGRVWRRYGTTRLRRAGMIVVLATLLLCAFSSALAGLAGATSGVPALSQAMRGYTHLKNGETLLTRLSAGLLSATTVSQAQAEFAASQRDFTQAHASLERLPGSDFSAPLVGEKLRVALQLTVVGATFAQMGVEASDAGALVVGAVSDPFANTVVNGQSLASLAPGATAPAAASAPAKVGLTTTDIAAIQAKLTAISPLLASATAQVNALNPSDLSFNADIAAQVAALKAALPRIQQDLTQATALLPIVGPLLGVGAPARYLVEFMDSTELRPGGGYIGEYGAISLSGGALSTLTLTNVDLLDRPFEVSGGLSGTPGCIQAPQQYEWFTNVVVPCWSMRDSNLSANFPTSAASGQANYHLEGGKGVFQGVIAITPWLLEKLIAITGPVTVPEFKSASGVPISVTSTNMMDVIHCALLCLDQQYDYIRSVPSRPDFTADLIKHLLAQVKAKFATDGAQVAQATLDALTAKDLQVYINNSKDEALLQRFNLAGAIQAPKTGDSLMVVDANIIANKANNFFTYTMTDQVSIDSAGTATHHLTLRYTWPQSANYEKNAFGSYGAKWMYEDYLRVYVPSQAQLAHTTGWFDYLGAAPAHNRQVYTGYIVMDYHSPNPAITTGAYPATNGPYPNEITITLDYTVPNAATRSGNVWTYPLLIQHQAGHAPDALWNITETVTPACGKVTSASAPWRIIAGGTSATLKEALVVDTSYTMTYTCAG